MVMSQISRKQHAVTLDSLLQDETFHTAQTKTSLRDWRLRECRDLYLKAQFPILISKIYHYKLLGHSGFEDYADDLWNWFLTAVSGLRHLDELTPAVRKHVRQELGRNGGGIFSVTEKMRVLCREKLLLNYFKAGIRFGSLDTDQYAEFLQDLNSTMISQIGKLVLEVHSEQEIKLLVKMIETNLFELQVRCLHKKLDKALYWSLCRKFPLLSSTLSGISLQNGPHSCTVEESILLQLEPKKTLSNSVSPESTSNAHLKFPTDLSTARAPDTTIPPIYHNEENKDLSGKTKSSLSLYSISKYLPIWLTDLKDTRSMAVLIMVVIILRKVRWVRALASYGLLSMKDIVEPLFNN